MYVEKANTPAPPSILEYMRARFPDVTFTDIRTVKGVPPGYELQGFQIKLFTIMFNQFEEFLFLDTDNMPVVDPAIIFESKLYKRTGALFWPDFCSYITVMPSAYALFDAPLPPKFPNVSPDRRHLWLNHRCMPQIPTEIQAGDILMNKKTVWKGLWFTFFMNMHLSFFKTVIWEDKMTYPFAFNYTSTPFAITPIPFYAVGRAAGPVGEQLFCMNTFGQRHPESGKLLWLHRYLQKFQDAVTYLRYGENIPRIWTHVCCIRVL